MCSLRRRSPTHHLFPGLVMLTIGVLFLLDRMNVMEFGASIWRLWPAALVFMGIQHLLRRDNVGWGVGLVLLGAVYFLINFEAFGLGWDNGWPLILVAVGIGFIAGSFHRPRVEVPREEE